MFILIAFRIRSSRLILYDRKSKSIVFVYVCRSGGRYVYVSVSADSEAKRAPKEPVAIQKGKLEKGTGGNRNEAEVSQKGIKVP